MGSSDVLPFHPLHDPPKLAKHEVHLWLIHLAVDPVNHYHSLLSPPEQDQAGRFVNMQLTNRYVARRAARRIILAKYCDRDPLSLVFEANNGKPHLPHLQDNDIHFNATHSGDWAILAIGHSELGVDLEQVKPIVKNRDPMLRRVLCDDEYRIVSGFDETTQSNIFFDYWVCKEAIVKATGEGLSGALETINLHDLTVTPTDQWIDATRHDQPWAVRRLAISNLPDYRSAICVRDPRVHLRGFQFQHEK